jgi:hypothetical protein
MSPICDEKIEDIEVANVRREKRGRMDFMR